MSPTSQRDDSLTNACRNPKPFCCRYEAWYIRCVHPEGMPFRQTMQMLIAQKLGLSAIEYKDRSMREIELVQLAYYGAATCIQVRHSDHLWFLIYQFILFSQYAIVNVCRYFTFGWLLSAGLCSGIPVPATNENVAPFQFKKKVPILTCCP